MTESSTSLHSQPVIDWKNCKDESMGLEKKGQQGEVYPSYAESKLTQMEQRRGQLGILSDEKHRVGGKTQVSPMHMLAGDGG